MKSLLALLLVAPFFAHTASAQSTGTAQEPPAPEQNAASATSCPIRADEAYLSNTPATAPPADSAHPAKPSLTLHLSLLDNDAKPIRSFSVHARIVTTPALDNLPHSAVLSRSSRDRLESRTPHPMEWTFPAARFTTQLQDVWFDKVVFADGSTWMKTPHDGCSFRATGHIVQTHR